MVAGTAVMTIAFVVMALGTSVAIVTAGWCLAQLGANATLAPFIAMILFAFILPDQHLKVKPSSTTAGEWVSTLCSTRRSTRTSRSPGGRGS